MIRIAKRLPMQDRTVANIEAEAAERGAYASPVFNRGRIDEVHLFRDGRLMSSLFRSPESRLSIWRPDGTPEVGTNSVKMAVQRGLDPLRQRRMRRAA